MRSIMLRLTIVFLTVAFASAMPDHLISQFSNLMVEQISDIPTIDKIPAIEEFADPEFLASPPEDAKLTTLQLVSKYGFNGELHTVTTADGYILQLHRIPGRTNSSATQKPVAFVMHGILGSSACWVLTGPEKGLAFILAEAGYDVWLGNARGTLYSRKHTSLSTDDKEYWDFSWHEIGTHDLPAMIDYTLKTTGREKLFYLGHSQGTTSFFVMASTMPEYQSKIQAMFAMAPIAYCGRMISPALQFLARLSGSIDAVTKLIGMYEFDPTNDAINKFKELVCSEGAITQPLCSNVLFLIAGYNNEQFNKTLLPIIVGHLPAGASTKQMIHYAQLIKSGIFIGPGKFRQFDYGLIGNKKEYGSFSPPKYDLGKIQVPISLHYGTNDWLANVKDVDKLYEELGNPFGKFRVPHDKFNHLDFMWALDAKELLYEKMLSIMTRFQN